MTDPLSITASVGGLALLAKEIVQGISSIIQSVRGAKAEMQSLSNSVANLYGILKGLGLILDQLPSNDATNPGKVIFDCSITLENIRKLLAKCGSNDKTGGTSVAGAPPSRPNLDGTPSTWEVTKHRAIWVFKKHDIEKLLDDLESHKSTLLLAMTQNSLSGIVEVLRRQDEAMSELREMKDTQARIWAAKVAEETRRLSEDRRKILDDVSELHAEHSLHKHLGLRQDGTGLWFINGSDFEKFVDSPNSQLWLYGIPGAGKSVLSAAIIDSLQRSEKMAVAFFFCEYGNRATQTTRQILGSIARQLAVQNTDSFTVLEEFHNTHDGSHDFSKIRNDSEWVELIQDLSTNFDTTTNIIDGLDECLDDRSRIVRNLAMLSSRGSIKTLFASREELEIREDLGAFESLSIAADRADVRLYVAAHLDSRFKRMTSKDPKLRQEILESLVDRSEGMFQWVKCQLDHLESLATNGLRRKALNDLPPDLPQTYQRILHRAVTSQPQSTLEFIEKTLRWIALARDPMSISAIAEAISVEPGEKELDDTLEIGTILRPCSSLVRTVEGVVSFSHFSVKEYLCEIDTKDLELARFRVNKENDQDYLASVCLSYLLLDDFSALELQGFKFWDEHTAHRPFYNYAARSWLDHAIDTNNSQILGLELELFKPEKSDQFCLWAWTWLPYRTGFGYRRKMADEIRDITPLHVACVCCLPEVVDNLIKEGADVNRCNRALGTPLICAIGGWSHAFGEDEWPSQSKMLQVIERLLLEDVTRDILTHNPLEKAVERKDDTTVALLLKRGFPVTAEALEKAMLYGSRKVVKAFLTETTTALLDPDSEPVFTKMVAENLRIDRDEDKDIPSEAVSEHMKQNYLEMLPIAASHGRLETFSSLLPCLSTMPKEEKDELLSLCLSDAATNDQAEVVNFLLGKGVDPSYQRRSDGMTALHSAAWECDSKIVRSLLQSCQDPRSALEKKNRKELTPWLCTIEVANLNVLEIFLEVHPDIDLQQTTSLGLTAAHLAAKSRNENLFRFLQERSVDFSSPAANGQRPIHVLLESFADIWGSQESIRILRSLIKLEDDLSTTVGSGKTLLHLLAGAREPSGDSNEILREVLEDERYGKSRENALISTDSESRTPLHLSLENFCERLYKHDSDLEHDLHQMHQIRLLANPPFEFRDHLSARGHKLRTPLIDFAKSTSHIAFKGTSKYQSQEIVSDVFRILIESEKDASFSRQQDYRDMTAMHYVAESMSGFPFDQVISAFLKHEVDFSIRNKEGETPMMVAARSKRKNINFLRLILPRMKSSDLDELCEDGIPLVHHICKKPGVERIFPDHLPVLAQSTALDKDGCMPLIHLLKSIKDLDTASRMIEAAGKTIDACDKMNRSCLYWACRLGADSVVAALIDRYGGIDDPLIIRTSNGSVWRDAPLLVAANYENVDTIRMLIQKGANALVEDEDGWQLLHYAMRDCCFPRFREFLDILVGFNLEAPINIYRDNRYFNDARALHLASMQTNTAPLKWLLANERNLELDPKTDCGTTPLQFACWKANLTACRILVTAGASPFEVNKDGFSSLHFACKSGSLEICNYLLSDHGKLAVTDTQALCSPVEIASRKGNIKMVKALLRYNCPVSATAELEALQVGNLELADFLREQLQTKQKSSLDQEILGNIAYNRLEIICQTTTITETALFTLIPRVKDLNHRVNSLRETPLHIASTYGWTYVVKALIYYGASLDLLDSSSNTPLLVAARHGHLECVKILHHNGGDIEQRCFGGLTTLHLAAMNGNYDSLEYFLEQGLDVNAEDEEGMTSLHWARDLACIDLLLRRGADPFRLSRRWASPLAELSRADIKGDWLCRILTDQPDQAAREVINKRVSWCNATLLYLHTFQGNYNAVNILLETGAEVNQLGGKFGTPIQAAWKQGQFGVATLLLRKGAKPFQRAYAGVEQAAWHWELSAQQVLQSPDGTWTAS